MASKQIAIVCDFDETLTHDSTTLFLEHKNIDTEDFWNNRVSKKIRGGWDPSLAWLDEFLVMTKPGEPLVGVSNAELADFGKQLKFFPGVPEVFHDLNKICEEEYENASIRFYIVSGGLEEMLNASSVAKDFDAIRACRFEERDGQIAAIKNTIDFTTKTRCLYEISKGVVDQARGEPWVVNQYMPQPDRPIPFENMVYLGDGLTDVPSFSIVKAKGGRSIGVFNPNEMSSVQKAWMRLGATNRVQLLMAPTYESTDPLGSMLRMIVKEMCLRFKAS